MNFIKRGCLSLQRQKGKTFLLFLLIFIIGNVLAATIAIQQSSENVEKNIKGKLGNMASIALMPEALDKEYKISMDYTREQADRVTALPYVASSEYTIDFSPIYQKKIEPYRLFNDIGENLLTQAYIPGNFTHLSGVTKPNFADLANEAILITEGRTFTQEEIDKNAAVVMVSDKLAEKNAWHLEDTILYDALDFEFDDLLQPAGEPLFSYQQTFQIIGMYRLPNTLINKFGAFGMRSNDSVEVSFQESFQNTLYTPFEHARVFCLKEREALGKPPRDTFSSRFTLKSPEDNDVFRQEAEAILGYPWTITYDQDQYNAIASGVGALKNLAGKVFFVSILVAIILVTLVVLLFLRDRKQELGIYLALGESRTHVAGQLLFEVLTIALFAITFSVFTGNLVAEGISENILASELSAEDTLDYVGITRKFIDAEDVTAAYELQIQPTYIISLYVVGFLTILAAVVVPLTYLFRLRPRAILL